MASITWVDWFLVGVIALSTLISLIRGFTREIFSLLTWLIAFLVAVHFTPALAAWLAQHIGSEELRIITAFGGLFIATIILGSLINFAIGQLVSGSGLSGTDRLLGSIFGVVRGVLVGVLLIIAAGLTPLVDQPVWKDAKLIPAFQPITHWMLSFVPQEATVTWLKELNGGEEHSKTSSIAPPPKRVTKMPAPTEAKPVEPRSGEPHGLQHSQPEHNPSEPAAQVSSQQPNTPTFSYPGKVQPNTSPSTSAQ